ncbi:MAG: hypothetical protein AAGI68_13425 [Planctomycetota bacterium]
MARSSGIPSTPTRTPITLCHTRPHQSRAARSPKTYRIPIFTP